MTARRLVPILAIVVIVAAALVAVVLSSNLTPPPGGSSSAPPTESAVAPTAPGSGTASDAPPPSGGIVLEGDPLPEYAGPTDDPAVGLPIPTVSATGMDGQPVSIGPGKPTIVLFLAHWCPHCQREVPLVQDWVDAGGLPPEVDLIAVSTAFDPSAPNYPPADWLAREGWTAPTIEDPDREIATAYGLSAFPYWVIADATGAVQLRLTGEQTVEQLDAIVEILISG